MDVISMISKDPAYPDGEIKDGLHGDMSPYVCNGPHVHEYLQEMNKRVLSRFDLITVGETPGVTTEEAKKYANLDGSELNMVFQFEHMGTTDGKYGKWTTKKPEMKKVRFRTLGCYPLTGGILSDADTLDAIIDETLSSVESERTSRIIDSDGGAASMEKRKREGYF